MPIDRRALVSRHDPRVRAFDPRSPLSVGNGEFTFTADSTGVQTFEVAAAGAVPLCTMAQWGWHSYPAPPGQPWNRAALRLERFDAGGREVGYMTDPVGQEELFAALRVNPHRLNLARLGFVVPAAAQTGDGRAEGRDDIWGAPSPSDFARPEQILRLREGRLESAFSIAGRSARVETLVHPDRDLLALRVESTALRAGLLALRLAFSYGSQESGASDWNSPDKHSTLIVGEDPGQDGRREGRAPAGRGPAPRCLVFDFERRLDADRYWVRLATSAGGRVRRIGRHEFIISAEGEALELTLEFSPVAFPAAAARGESGEPPSWETCRAAASRWWGDFWDEGGAMELAESSDSRAAELERRIVLSQYLTAIQCSGSKPPQETGLTCNSWYGKFHLEMHYWHAAHFAQWGRARLLQRSLGWYRGALDGARARAVSQGYRGARWPKMTDPSGMDSPSPIGPLLCWQQPHPIMYAELLRRAGADRAFLASLDEVVFETADFMADYARWEEASGRWILGPPLIPAQEAHRPAATLNPTFELEYWRWGLEAAIAWAERARWADGKAPASVERWRAVLRGLAKPAVGRSSASSRLVYLAHEACPDTFDRYAIDHPSMLLALGMLPGCSIDRAIMSNTCDEVLARWDFTTSWGWDFPAVAMCAARLGRPADAVDALLMREPKNTFLPNGHNAQLARASGARLGSVDDAAQRIDAAQRDNGVDLLFTAKLPLYLPGNGALLLAAGMMAAGWDGSGDKPAPGFPSNGSWKVGVEGIARLP